MSPIPLLLCLVAASALLAGEATVREAEGCSARAQPLSPYAATAEVPGYEAATAHEPHLDDRKLWPLTNGREGYATQAWPKARLLVWAHPGEDGHPKGERGKWKTGDPANWLEDGKPAASVPDENTDVIIPAHEKRYTVSVARWEHAQQRLRHVTIGRNATFAGGAKGEGRTFVGNIWIKRGGKIDTGGSMTFKGNGHTFFRNDNPYVEPMTMEDNLNLVAQYFTINKATQASVEFLGQFGTADEFAITGCTAIVGPESRLQPGRNASPSVDGKGTLAIMDNARFYAWTNTLENCDLAVDGSVRGGLPERPLRSDAYLLLSHKNFAQVRYEGPSPERVNDQEKREYRRTPSLLLRPGSTLTANAEKPGAARLVLAYAGYLCYWEQRAPEGTGYSRYQREREHDKVARYPYFDGLPRAITVYVGPGCTVENVLFDQLAAGGLLLVDPAERKAWKNVQYGPGCKAQGEALVTKIQALTGENPAY